MSENMSIEDMAAAAVETDIRVTSAEMYNKLHPDKKVEPFIFSKELELVFAEMKENSEFKTNIIQQMKTIEQAEKIGTPKGVLNRAFASSRVTECLDSENIVQQLRTPPMADKNTNSLNEEKNISQSVSMKISQLRARQSGGR